MEHEREGTTGRHVSEGTESLARELLDALDSGSTVGSIAARHPHFGWDEGYAIAAALVGMRRARGETPVGRKIGFTNRNIWAEYGAIAPIWAHVYDDTLVMAPDGRGTVSLSRTVSPRLEPEIAFRLKTPLAAGVTDPERILEAVDWVAPSFEIVDCHLPGWRFGAAESVADFSLHWRLVVGAPRRVLREDLPSLAAELRDCRVSLLRDGEIVDRGFGSNALGHPALALAHLAEVLSDQPAFEPLAAGEIVTTGTVTAAMPIAPGETWASVFEGLRGVGGLTVRLVD